MAEFLISLISNLIATFAGVRLAMKGELSTNRVIVAEAEKVKRKEEADRLDRALTSIKEVLTFNLLQLPLMLQDHIDNKATFYFRVNDSAWDVVKDDVVQYLHDPVLQQRIAYHFSGLKELRKIEALYLDSTFGVSATIAAVNKAEPAIKDHLEKQLPKLINDLINQADDLVKAIDSVQAKI